jgi:hypothetical protein
MIKFRDKVIPLSAKQKRELKLWNCAEELDAWPGMAAELRLEYKRVVEWNKPRSVGNMHASSFTRKCDMFLFLERLGCKPKPRWGAKVQRILDRGTITHELLHYYQNTRANHFGYECRSEINVGVSNVAKEIHTTGNGDDVTLGWPLTDRRTLWEYKSINLRGFNAKRKPDRDHIIQAHVYMGCLGIAVCVFNYFCLDNATSLPFIVEFNPDIWEIIQKRARKIDAHAKVLEEPERDVTNSCWYCAYLDDCSPPLPRRNASAPEV